MNMRLPTHFLLLRLLLLAVENVDVVPVCSAQRLLLAPNVSSCHLPTDLPLGETPFNCCPPSASYSPRLFRPIPPNSSSDPPPLRVRRPAHSASSSYAQELARAYALMKALPSDDPRSFYQQANIHCAYCNTAYDQLNSSQPYQIHGSWLFFPFHRWYLYFHERILAKLLQDDSFALAFWNYDLPAGASIPWLFTASFNDTLASSHRNPLHNYPNASVSIASSFAGDRLPLDVKARENANSMYRALIRDASTQRDFFGAPYRQGDPLNPGAGTVELYPHNTIHVWTGNKTAVGMKDMGSFYAAARDPVFYAHHAQLDRLWEVWKTLPGHDELREEDYLNSEFVFYNEDAELVRVKVEDALNTTLLGYAYEQVEMPWLDAVPTYESSGPADLTSNFTLCTEGEPLLAPCSILLQRDPNVTKESPWQEESVVTHWICTPTGSHLDIYLNLPSADANTGTGCNEYVTSVETLSASTILTGADTVNVTNTAHISERLAALNLTEQSTIVITLVPTFPEAAVLPDEALILLDYFIEYNALRGSTQPSHIITSNLSDLHYDRLQ